MMLAAPLGCAIGLALREALPPSQWQGALNGGITGAALIGVPALLVSSQSKPPDAGALAFTGAFIVVAALAGWIAQRFILNWPEQG